MEIIRKYRRKHQGLFIGAIVLTIILLCKICQMSILAFSSNDALSQIFRLFAMIFWIAAEAGALGYLKLRMAASILSAGLLGFLPPHFIGFGGMLTGIYRTEIYLSNDYGSFCVPVSGEALEGGVIRVCERRGWGQLGMDAIVVKFDGNPGNLISKKYSKVSQHIGYIKPLIPFGVAKYDCFHITGPYYVLLFGDEPV